MGRPQTLWFTGLSGAGKSTLTKKLLELYEMNSIPSVILDGDELRTGLCSDLGFSDQDRNENIRRVTEVAKLFLRQGFVVIVATISPFTTHRTLARDTLSPLGEFFKIYCNVSFQTCEERDVKGLYAKARRSEGNNFTGLGSQYERPLNPEISIDTSKMTIDESIEYILELTKLGASRQFDDIATPITDHFIAI